MALARALPQLDVSQVPKAGPVPGISEPTRAWLQVSRPRRYSRPVRAANGAAKQPTGTGPLQRFDDAAAARQQGLLLLYCTVAPLLLD